jgi:hypothetical protein
VTVRRRVLTLAGFASGALAGTALYRRSFGRRRERVDVYFDDGTMVSYGESAPEAERILALAGRILATARR